MARALGNNLTKSDFRRTIEDLNHKTRHIVLIKPGRRLGGAWMDELASAKRALNLCYDCEHKYRDWYKRVRYEKRMVLELSDCDGCGQSMQYTYGWYYSLRAH